MHPHRLGRDCPGPPPPSPPHPHTSVEAAVFAPVLGGEVRAEAGSAEPRLLAQLSVQLRQLLHLWLHLRDTPGWLEGWGRVGRGVKGTDREVMGHRGTSIDGVASGGYCGQRLRVKSWST